MQHPSLYTLTILALPVSLFVLSMPALAERARPAGETAGKMPITTDSPAALEAYVAGRELLDSFRIDESLPYFQEAVELDPDFVLAWIGLAFSQPRYKIMFEQAEHALALLDRVDVTEGERLLVRGFHASLNADPETWQKSYQRLAELYPQDERCLVQAGTVHLVFLNDPVTAHTYFRRALEVNPQFPTAWERTGQAFFQQNEYAAAETAFKKFIEVAPRNPRAYEDHAGLLLKLGRFDEAREIYLKALELRPLFESAHQGIVTVMLHEGKYEKARRHLEALHEIAPNDGFRSGIHFALAVTHADEGEYDAAVAELEKNFALSKKIDDTFAMAVDLANMGRVLLHAKKFDAALERYEQVYRTLTEADDQPEKRKLNQRYARLFRQGIVGVARGDLETARARLVSMLALAADYPPWARQQAHDLRGRIALAEGRFGEAIGEFMKSTNTDAYTMYRMALAFEGKGDLENYRKMLRYVDEYRGVLNLNYAFVRHNAKTRLAASADSKATPR